MTELTRDPVNQRIIGIRDEFGTARLGSHCNKMWHEDPKHLLFSMARYKFVAKMLSGRKNVLEVGCGDSFNSRLVRQEVKSLLVTDVDPLFIQDAEGRASSEWPMEMRVHDNLRGPIPGNFDAVYSLDVLEHIQTKDEELFLKNLVQPLSQDGVAIVGMPSLESQSYSKPVSVTGHINCKMGPDLKALLERFFTNVFLFSMNDEVVHTGYSKMAQYLIVLCCGKRIL